MRFKSISFLCVLSALLFCSFSAQALKPRSKYFRSEEEANQYLINHYNLGCRYYNQKEWHRASSEFEKVIFYFPCSDTAAEASYYLAVCYFEIKEYDFANEEFSNYLKASQHPAFFEEAVAFKFCIAEHFKRGKKRRPFKMRYLPKWLSAQDSALTTYDEVVAALPNHELAVQALYSKGNLLKQMREYREAVEAYQTIIRRFPKHEIVPACYLHIADAYVQQSRLEFQNPDILALAELNVRKFKEDFPRDERVAIAEDSVCQIKEIYAKGLCDLGLFYERIHHPDAAAIYYQSSIEEFPDTHVAQFCRSRLICLGYIQEEAAPCSEETLCPASCESDSVNETIPPAYSDSSLETDPPSLTACDPHLLLLCTAMPSQNDCDYSQVPEYVHYSLTKKREVKHPCVESEYSWEQGQSNRIEGEVPPPPCPVNQGSAEQPRELWHYSVIKHRDQHVRSQE